MEETHGLSFVFHAFMVKFGASFNRNMDFGILDLVSIQKRP
jgi:hypothetical protein